VVYFRAVERYRNRARGLSFEINGLRALGIHPAGSSTCYPASRAVTIEYGRGAHLMARPWSASSGSLKKRDLAPFAVLLSSSRMA
jgi:hypothetical protein